MVIQSLKIKKTYSVYVKTNIKQQKLLRTVDTTSAQSHSVLSLFATTWSISKILHGLLTYWITQKKTSRANAQPIHFCNIFMASLQSSASHNQPSQNFGHFMPLYNRMTVQSQNFGHYMPLYNRMTVKDINISWSYDLERRPIIFKLVSNCRAWWCVSSRKV